MTDLPDNRIARCCTPLGNWWRYQHLRNQPSTEKQGRWRIAERTAPPGARKPTASSSAASRFSEREARKRLEAGETQRSVARSYNVSHSTISRLTA